MQARKASIVSGAQGVYIRLLTAYVGSIERVCTFFVPLSAKQFLANKFKFESISRSVCVSGSLLQAEVTFTDLLDGLLLHCCTEMNGSQGMCNVIIQAPPTPTYSSQRITFYIWGLQ